MRYEGFPVLFFNCKRNPKDDTPSYPSAAMKPPLLLPPPLSFQSDYDLLRLKTIPYIPQPTLKNKGVVMLYTILSYLEVKDVKKKLLYG
jgi:hypothetical protein